MAKNIQTHSCPVRYKIKQIFAILSLLLCREGRSVSKIFSGVSDIDKQLLQECQTDYQGELSFFAVSASSRGSGVGKKLFQAMLGYMKSQNITDFYLFTDTSCNYGFYEHQGMTRRCEQSKSFKIKGKEEHMTFYLYDLIIT